MRRATALLLLLLLAKGRGYSTGLSSCQTSPGHGTSNSGAGSFSLELRTTAGATVTSYSAGESYVVRLAGGTFRGFTSESRLGTAREDPTSLAGTLSPKTNSKASSSCSYVQMTHTGNADKTSAEFNWAAPDFAGLGTVSFWASVVTSQAASWHEHVHPYAHWHAHVVCVGIRHPDCDCHLDKQPFADAERERDGDVVDDSLGVPDSDRHCHAVTVADSVAQRIGDGHRVRLGHRDGDAVTFEHGFGIRHPVAVGYLVCHAQREQLRHPDVERLAVVLREQQRVADGIVLRVVDSLSNGIVVGHAQSECVVVAVANGELLSERESDCQCDVIGFVQRNRTTLGKCQPFAIWDPLPDGYLHCNAVCVILSLSIEDLQLDGQSGGFRDEFRSQVATALRVAPSRIANITVVAGSVRVSFVLLPPDSRPGAGEAAVPTAEQVAIDLQRQVADPSSALRTGGGFAAAVDAAAGVGVVLADSVAGLAEAVREAGELFDPASFDHEAVLGPSRAAGVVMRWSILPAGLLGRPSAVWRAQFEWAVDSWASVGIRRSDESTGMSDVWALLLLPRSSSASGRVLEADLHNTTLGGVVPHGAQNLDLVRVQQVSGQGVSLGRRSLSGGERRMASGEGSGLVWRADVERLLATLDARDFVIEPLQDVRVVYALGSGPSEAGGRDSMQYHGANRGERIVNLGSGKVALAPVNALVLVHGSLMFLAWGVLLPLGALIARFARGVSPSTGPGACWFRCHWLLQTAGTLASLGGAGTAIVLVAQSGGSHFGSLHKAGGLAVVLLGSGLVVLGMSRPAKDSEWRSTWLCGHRFSGTAALLLGAATIVTGLLQAAAVPLLLGLASTVLALEVVAFGILTRAAMSLDAPPKSAKHVQRMNTRRPSSADTSRQEFVSPLAHMDKSLSSSKPLSWT